MNRFPKHASHVCWEPSYHCSASFQTAPFHGWKTFSALQVEWGQGCTTHLEISFALCPDNGLKFLHNESALK